MSDENITPIWANQSSQNNQAITNQTWGDFVLDFGDGEKNEQVETSVVELNNLEPEKTQDNEEMVKVDIDFNSDDLFGEEKKDANDVNQQGDIKMEAENIDDWKVDGFDITLDDSQNVVENVDDINIEMDDTEKVIQQEDNKKIDTAVSSQDENILSVEQTENVVEKASNEELVKKTDENIGDENNLDDSVQKSSETIDDFSISLDDDQSTEDISKISTEQERNQDDNVVDLEKDLNIKEPDQENDVVNGTIAENNVDGGISIDGKNETFDNGVKLDENIVSMGDESHVQNLNLQENVLDNETKISSDVSIDDNKDETIGENVGENIGEVDHNSEIISDNFSTNDVTWDDASNIFKALSDEELWENVVNDKNINDKTVVTDNKEFENMVLDENLGSDSVQSEPQIATKPEIDGSVWDLVNEPLVDNKENVQLWSSENLSDIENSVAPVSWNLENNVEVSPTSGEQKNEIDSNLNQDSVQTLDLLLDYNDSADQVNQVVSSQVDVNVKKNSSDASENISEDQVQLFQPIEQSISQEIHEDSTITQEDNQSLSENVVIDNQTMDQSQLNQQIITDNSGEKNLDSQNIFMNLDAPENNAWNQEIRSTLSLDQILDSELTNNPDYSDNSKSVPTNVPTKTWLFANKKVAGIVVWILIFALVGFVALLAFPQKNTERKIWDVVEEYTGNLVGDEVHNSADDLEDSSGQIDDEIEGGVNNVSTSIVEEFPDVEWEDLIDLEVWNLEPQPYNCVGEECNDWSDFLEWLWNVTAEDILLTIEDFESEAEQYYSLWEQIEDKKLIKYATQLIHLCDSYKTQIENGEWADNESFETFKSQIESILSKIEFYMGWSEDIDIFEQSGSEV